LQVLSHEVMKFESSDLVWLLLSTISLKYELLKCSNLVGLKLFLLDYVPVQKI